MKFSVIIPIYNSEKYLRECLDSVQNQTYTNWECICVDDGSTDASGKIIDEYALHDCRFKPIHKPNGGEGSARNAGLEVFEGEWVYFLDSDDVLNTQTLEVCVQGVRQYTSADLVSVRMQPYRDGEQPEWTNNSPSDYQAINIQKYVDERSLNIPVWSMAYQADLVREHRFGNLKVGADRVFVAGVINQAKLVVLNEYTGYGYRTRPGSIVNSAMTEVKFLADLRHRMFFYNLFQTSTKQFASSLMKTYAQDFTEYMAYCFFQMTASDQRKCVEEWADSMLKVAAYPKWNAWRKFTMRTFGKTKSRAIVWLLCFLPYWLKVHGVNRQLKVQRKNEFI